MCSGRCPSATSCHTYGCLERGTLMKCDEICQLLWEEEHTERPKPPPPWFAPLIHIPSVTCIALGVMGNSSVHIITSSHWQCRVTRVQFTRVTFLGPWSYCLGSYIACMAALKRVNQGGKLSNLCGGVRKMLLKKHGFAFSVMSGVRNFGARILRTNQRKRVRLGRVSCDWKEMAVHEKHS